MKLNNDIDIDVEIRPRIFFMRPVDRFIGMQAQIKLEVLANEWWENEGKNKFMDYVAIKQLEKSL